MRMTIHNKPSLSGFLGVLEANSSNFTENIRMEQKYMCAVHLETKACHYLAFIPRGATSHSSSIMKIILPLTGRAISICPKWEIKQKPLPLGTINDKVKEIGHWIQSPNRTFLPE